MPLYSGGLCDAEMTTPRSSPSSATAGVGTTPASTAEPPADATPRANASSSASPEARVSRPMKTRPRPDQSADALPSRSTRSAVTNSPTMPPTFSGYVALVRQMLRGKYSSSVRPLTQVAPSPGRRITRATDVLRLPVPRYWAIWLKSLLQVQGLGVLRAMRMLRPRVDLQLVDLLSRQPVLREHPLHGHAPDLGRP